MVEFETGEGEVVEEIEESEGDQKYLNIVVRQAMADAMTSSVLMRYLFPLSRLSTWGKENK